MRKISVIAPIVSVLMGVCGFVLRNKELKTIFDAVTGFPEKGAEVTKTLILTAIIAAIIGIILAAILPKRSSKVTELVGAFQDERGILLVIKIICGAGLIVSAILGFVLRNPANDIFELIYSIFAALSGIAFIVLAVSAYKDTEIKGLKIFACVPTLFFSIWLVLIYKNNAANPILLEYCYQCLAAASLALVYYIYAGYAFGKIKAQPRSMVFFKVCAVFFSIVVLADAVHFEKKIMLIASALYTSINMCSFICNVSALEKQENGESE